MTTNLPRARDHVARMAAYPPVDLSAQPDGRQILIAQNESPWPPSPRAVEAAQASVTATNLYSDTDWRELRLAIAAVHDLEVNDILVGAGSMELINALIRAFAGPGDQVISTEYGYAFLKTSVETAGADYLAAPEPEMTVSVDAILAMVSDRTRIVGVANPGNPTGTRISRTDLIRLREGLRSDILLLIDEAYAEFTDHLGETVFDLVAHGNTVVTRTFSKAYGLAGMRVGWGLFPAAIGLEVRKLLIPGSTSVPALAAATAAMNDQAYMRDVCEKTAALRERFAKAIAQLGFAAPESHTNFTLIPFDDRDQAARADAFLRDRGIVMRGMGLYDLPHCLRATMPDDDDLTAVINALTEWRNEET